MCRPVAVWPRTCRRRCPAAEWWPPFTACPATELGHIGEPINSDVLICGDDASAVKTMSEIIAKIPGCRPLDRGGAVERDGDRGLRAVMLQLDVRYKTRVAPKLTGIKGDHRDKRPQSPAAAPSEAVASPA